MAQWAAVGMFSHGVEMKFCLPNQNSAIRTGSEFSSTMVATRIKGGVHYKEFSVGGMVSINSQRNFDKMYTKNVRENTTHLSKRCDFSAYLLTLDIESHPCFMPCFWNC